MSRTIYTTIVLLLSSDSIAGENELYSTVEYAMECISECPLDAREHLIAEALVLKIRLGHTVTQEEATKLIQSKELREKVEAARLVNAASNGTLATILNKSAIADELPEHLIESLTRHLCRRSGVAEALSFATSFRKAEHVLASMAVCSSMLRDDKDKKQVRDYLHGLWGATKWHHFSPRSVAYIAMLSAAADDKQLYEEAIDRVVGYTDEGRIYLVMSPVCGLLARLNRVNDAVALAGQIRDQLYREQVLSSIALTAARSGSQMEVVEVFSVIRSPLSRVNTGVLLATQFLADGEVELARHFANSAILATKELPNEPNLQPYHTIAASMAGVVEFVANDSGSSEKFFLNAERSFAAESNDGDADLRSAIFLAQGYWKASRFEDCRRIWKCGVDRVKLRLLDVDLQDEAKTELCRLIHSMVEFGDVANAKQLNERECGGFCDDCLTLAIASSDQCDAVCFSELELSISTSKSGEAKVLSLLALVRTVVDRGERLSSGYGESVSDDGVE